MHLKIHDITRHRNGVGGVGFYGVRFQHADGEEPERMMLGIVMDLDEVDEQIEAKGGHYNPPTAVIALDDPTETWRGDAFNATLRAAIKEHTEAEAEAWLEVTGGRAA